MPMSEFILSLPFTVLLSPHLNNKGVMHGYITSMCVCGAFVCVCVCPRFFSETAQLSNMGFAQLIGVVILMTTKLLF